MSAVAVDHEQRPDFKDISLDVCSGSEPGFYQWSRGVRMRANLDLLLDWAHTAGLGELALEHTHTLSSAINLLATPRKNLLQVKHTHTRTLHSQQRFW